MTTHKTTRLVLLAVALGLSVLTTACDTAVGVGIGYSYPGRVYGPMGGGAWGGGPRW